MTGAEVQVAFHVWPAYIGFGTHDTEHLQADVRAQIRWRLDGDDIVGSAQPWVPAGAYTHLLYFHDPTGPPCGSAQFAHPFHAPSTDFVVVDPIRNEDPALKALHGIAR